MLLCGIQRNKEYTNTLNNKKCVVTFCYDSGDCEIKYKNGKTDIIHCSLLKD